MSDVLDILEVDRGGPATPDISREKIIGPQRVAKKPGATRGSRRPEGINRELYALLYSDNKERPPLFPTEDGERPVWGSGTVTLCTRAFGAGTLPGV